MNVQHDRHWSVGSAVNSWLDQWSTCVWIMFLLLCALPQMIKKNQPIFKRLFKSLYFIFFSLPFFFLSSSAVGDSIDHSGRPGQSCRAAGSQCSHEESEDSPCAAGLLWGGPYCNDFNGSFWYLCTVCTLCGGWHPCCFFCAVTPRQFLPLSCKRLIGVFFIPTLVFLIFML